MRPSGGPFMDERSAVEPLGDGGAIVATRDPRATRVSAGRWPAADVFVHPLLASVATIFAHWEGWESFHAGALLVAGRAWLVAGERGAGKTSLLAMLSQRGLPVLSDDVVVVAGHTVFAGPRCLDLRPDDAIPSELRVAGTPVREGERLRLLLPPSPPEALLGGWIFLEWGSHVDIWQVDARDRLMEIGAARAIRRASGDPAHLLDLAMAPAVRLIRPRDWLGADSAIVSLMNAISAVQPG